MARILIADDELQVRTLLAEVISSMGHTSVEAEDGEEALRRYRTETVDLCIVDIQMPKKDGIVFLHEIKKIDPEAVVIVMTGFPSAETIIETIEDDGYTYVAKPIHINRIMDLIQRGLDFRKRRMKKETGKHSDPSPQS